MTSLSPPFYSLICYRDREVATFTQFHTQFDAAVKNLAKMGAEQTTKCQVHYKREFSNIGRCFLGLGQAMDQDGGGYNPSLNRAVIATGECYEEIGRLYEEQPRLDWEHLADMMHDYKGLLAGWPQVLQIHSVRRPHCSLQQTRSWCLSINGRVWCCDVRAPRVRGRR